MSETNLSPVSLLLPHAPQCVRASAAHRYSVAWALPWWRCGARTAAAPTSPAVSSSQVWVGERAPPISTWLRLASPGHLLAPLLLPHSEDEASRLPPPQNHKWSLIQRVLFAITCQSRYSEYSGLPGRPTGNLINTERWRAFYKTLKVTFKSRETILLPVLG